MERDHSYSEGLKERSRLLQVVDSFRFEVVLLTDYMLHPKPKTKRTIILHNRTGKIETWVGREEKEEINF